MYGNSDVMRRLALGGALQIKRSAEGWSVEQAAVHAGMGHMTFRRLEDGYSVRAKTYAAVDNLLGLTAGSVKRALGDDLLMVAFVQQVAGVDTSEVTASTAAAFVERFAKSTLSSSAKSTLNARTNVALHAAPSTGRWRPAVAPPRSAPTSDLQHAAELLDRLAQRHLTPALQAAMEAVLAAMPDLLRQHAAHADDGTTADVDADQEDDLRRIACS